MRRWRIDRRNSPESPDAGCGIDLGRPAASGVPAQKLPLLIHMWVAMLAAYPNAMTGAHFR